MSAIQEVITDTVRQLLDAMNAGVYLTDTTRHIVYWNRTAEEITGHKAEDVIGRRCSQGILQHIDAQGRPLCSTRLCPLHRAITTDRPSDRPVTIFALRAAGGRMPLSTMVAPVHDENGVVIGGIEVFRDETESLRDMEMARFVQRQMLPQELPDNDRISFELEYSPLELVGGDFVHVEQMSEDVYDLFVADVSGHGVGAALYIALIHSLVHECAESMGDPVTFLTAINDRLCVRTPDEAMVTAVAMTFDCAARTVRHCSAGHPPVLHQPGGGGPVTALESTGFPLGVVPNAPYEAEELTLTPGDRLLAYTDGVVELKVAGEEQLGTEGLMEMLAENAPQGRRHRLRRLYQALMDRCASPTVEDDITLVSAIMP